MSEGTGWVRRMAGRDPGAEHRASTPLELLFDLCFVVAVAQAAEQLHDGVGGGRPTAVVGYLMVFFAIWWAWMNFTWFASAYDTDDVPYRLLTLVQIAGGLVLAAGVPAAFERYDFTVITAGYVVMRAALIGQWLRAARQDPARRPATLRYAAGVGAVQLGWVLRLLLPDPWGYVGFGVLVVAEIAVPAWAEARGRETPWHPGHIAERYGLFTLIVLGEVVGSTTLAIRAAVADRGPSVGLLVTAAGALVLLFTLWWSYFKHDAAGSLRTSLATSLVWGYGHYLIFATAAAVGAGLSVAVAHVTHPHELGDVPAAAAVAVPAVLFLATTTALHGRLSPGSVPARVVVPALVLIVAAAALAGVIGVPAAVLAIGLVAAASLAVGLLVTRPATAG